MTSPTKRSARQIEIILNTALQVISEDTGVSILELEGPRRKPSYAAARQIYCFLCHDVFGVSHETTASHINRHHTTSIHNTDLVEAKCHTDKAFRDHINALTQRTYNRLAQSACNLPRSERLLACFGVADARELPVRPVERPPGPAKRAIVAQPSWPDHVGGVAAEKAAKHYALCLVKAHTAKIGRARIEAQGAAHQALIALKTAVLDQSGQGDAV